MTRSSNERILHEKYAFVCETHFYHCNSWQITKAKISFSFLNIVPRCYYVNPLCPQQESVPTKLKVAL